jgi:hypothetical protein|tara:strand:- start:229 stop:606 length:378 start_codon:yes stop_codon:yes gene_type:complete
MAMDLSQCGDIMGVPNAAGTDCECMPEHHWEADAYHPNGFGGVCVPDPPDAEIGDYTRVIPAADAFADPICADGFTLVDGVCVEDASAAAGSTFTPFVSCCTTELGNSIATSLIVSYGTELETIY